MLLVVSETTAPRALRGGLAQLARALDWQSRGQGFKSPILHHIIT